MWRILKSSWVISLYLESRVKPLVKNLLIFRCCLPLMKEKGTALYKKISKLYLQIAHEFSNSHLFIQKVIPLIQEEIFRLKTSPYKFESYIFKTLKGVIEVYPQKLHINIPSISSIKNVPLEVVLNASSHKEILSYLIKKKLVAISFARPIEYLRFIKKALSINLENNDCFQDYIEMKASRDLIVHNSGIINEFISAKLPIRIAGRIGDRIIVDREYFDVSIGFMKKIS